MIVVDASVAVKWIVDEDGRDLAASLLGPDAPPIAGPDLLLIEVAATLVRPANQRLVSKGDAALRVARWTALWNSDLISAHR